MNHLPILIAFSTNPEHWIFFGVVVLVANLVMWFYASSHHKWKMDYMVAMCPVFLAMVAVASFSPVYALRETYYWALSTLQIAPAFQQPISLIFALLWWVLVHVSIVVLAHLPFISIARIRSKVADERINVAAQ